MGEVQKIKVFFDKKRSYAERKTDQESDPDKKAWIVFGRDYKEYFTASCDKLPEKWLRERKDAGKGTNVIELFGPGTFVNLEAVDHITAVTLYDNRDANQRLQESSKKEVIAFSEEEGIVNLFGHGAWRRIYDVMSNRKIAGYDLCVCFPSGPFVDGEVLEAGGAEKIDTAKRLLAIYSRFLLKRAYQILSNDDSMLLTEVPTIDDFVNSTIKNAIVPAWVNLLQTKGFDIIEKRILAYPVQRRGVDKA